MTPEHAAILFGLQVVENPVLSGCNRAVCMGRVLHVSPAVLSLVRSSTEAELLHLFTHLRVITIPEYDPFEPQYDPFEPRPIT